MINNNLTYPVLVKSELKANVTETKVAMVKRVSVNKDKNSQYYLSVIFKDSVGKVVYGNYFEFDGSEGTRRTLEAMIDRAVLVTYNTSLYKGRVTVNIETIEHLPIKTAVEYEKLYFRSEYPDVRSNKCSMFISATMDKIKNDSLKMFIKQHVNLVELKDCADNFVFDGMTGAAVGSISAMLAAANGIYASQPDIMSEEDHDLLMGLILYMEMLYAKHKPLHAFDITKWQVEMIDTIRKDAFVFRSTGTSPFMDKFFEICENAAWCLAEANVVYTSTTQIYLYLKRSVENSYRILNVTSDIPGDVVITVGSKSYVK